MKIFKRLTVRKDILLRLALFLSPFLAFTFLIWFFGYTPFGNTPSAMAGDTQYLSYISSLHGFMTGDSFFDFAELATDASHLHARYMGSPFTWLNALFPVSIQASIALILLAVKSGLAALAFSFYLTKRSPSLPSPFVLILSFAFSLLACGALSNGMALLPEQLILLPLLLLFLELFFKNGKSGRLILPLTFIFLTGYAVAYATVFFALLALLLSFVKGDIKCDQYKTAAVKLLIAVALSILFALPILVHALTNLDAIGRVGTYSGSMLYRLPLLLLGFWPGVTIPEFPVFYIGIIPLLILPLFFTSREFSRRYRLVSGGLIFVLIACFFFVNPFGGALAFGLSLIVLLLTADLLSSDGKCQKLPLTITAAVLLILPMLLQKLAYKVPSDSGDVSILEPIFGVYLPLMLIFLASLVLSSLFEGKKLVRTLTSLLIVIVLADGCATTFYRISGKTFLETEDVVQQNAAEMADLLIRRTDKPLSPIERTRLYVTGDAKIPYNRPYLFGTEDAKSLSPALMGLLSSLGYDMNENRDGTPFPFADALLGVSHFVTDTSLSAPHYTLLEKDEDFSLYRADALPTVFAASEEILAYKAKDKSPFVDTNAFVCALLGTRTVLYRPLSDITVDQTDSGVTLKGNVDANGTLCYYSSKVGSANLNITVSGKTIRPYADGVDRGIHLFGNFDKANAVTATFNDAYPVTEECFYIADREALYAALSSLNQNRLQHVTLKGNVLIGEITIAKGMPVLMTTLPYDADYTVKIDGVEVKTSSVEGLLAVSTLDVGTHTVSIERPAALGIDMCHAVIGLIGPLLAIGLFVWQNKKSKQGKAQ